jgi:hypothetical protein
MFSAFTTKNTNPPASPAFGHELGPNGAARARHASRARRAGRNGGRGMYKDKPKIF